MSLLTVMSQNIQYGARDQGRLPGLYETVRSAARGGARWARRQPSADPARYL